MVLERLFRITMLLIRGALSFRGHEENFSGKYNGIFLSQIVFHANFDDVAKQLLSMPSGTTRYLSPTESNYSE